uniref:Uncharacterized protein n=1 Tax=Romanomermis culicivorax TaxID=13658 RepID=A0A915KXR6_ROMCU
MEVVKSKVSIKIRALPSNVNSRQLAPRRDFQEANPPRTDAERYKRYDPAVGIGISVTLGIFLFYLLSKVAVHFLWKRIRRKLQHTRRFGKYFPIDELPPLHIAQKIARDNGFEIPDSILVKLKDTTSSSSNNSTLYRSNLCKIENGDQVLRRSSSSLLYQPRTALTVAKITEQSPLGVLVHKLSNVKDDVSKRFLKPNDEAPNSRVTNKDRRQQQLQQITVNIICPTPSMTPSASRKELAEVVDDSNSDNENDDYASRGSSTSCIDSGILDSSGSSSRKTLNSNLLMPPMNFDFVIDDDNNRLSVQRAHTFYGFPDGYKKMGYGQHRAHLRMNRL